MSSQVLGPYHIMAEIAVGGQATLYKATHTFMNRTVALKVLHPHLITDSDFLQKFEDESKILAQLKHPNIVEVYDANTDGKNYWIAMEWLEGQSVEDFLKSQNHLQLDLAIIIADQVAAALEYTHSRGLIHRDIKPGNIMLLADGSVKVLDFGIAAIVAASQKASTRIGTVEYMSYEQFHGQADTRSDLYSLGAVLYEMLTGQLSPKIALSPPPPAHQINAAIPSVLESWLNHALAQQPDERPQTASAFRRGLAAAMKAPSQLRIPCPNCGAGNRRSATFCQACGKTITATVIIGACAACGASNSADILYCNSCQKPLSPQICPRCGLREVPGRAACCPRCGAEIFNVVG